MAVYGNLLSAFPELKRKIQLWTKQDKSDIRDIVGVFLPTKGDKLKRFNFSNRSGMSDYSSTAVDYSDDAHLYVSDAFRTTVNIGDYFYDPDRLVIHRIVGELNFDFEGGFHVYSTERVTGATVDQQEELKVKEAEFA